MTTTVIFLDPDQINPVDKEGLTDQERADRLDALSDALFAAARAPKASGEKAQALIAARQAKLAAAVAAELLG